MKLFGDKRIIIVCALLLAHIFFRFYNLEHWMVYENDQVENAWAATRIVFEQKYPLVGMVAKANSGIYIGPLYYYLVALFYMLTGFHPVASAILAACTSLLAFFVLYFVTKQLYNASVALWASFIYVFSIDIIFAERVQWPVNFIPLISYLVMYVLYKILMGNAKYIFHLAIIVGLSFHIHFTSIYYPIIILATLPFFPWSVQTVRYILMAIPLFFMFFIPNIMFELQKKNYSNVGALTNYSSTYSHGFHLRRFLQLIHEPVIEYEGMVRYKFFRPFILGIYPVFSLLLYLEKNKKKWLVLSYLVFLWILVPWVIFTFYSGEISNYYFSSLRFIALGTLGYISWWLWKQKSFIKYIPLAIWGFIAITNTLLFLNPRTTNYEKYMTEVKRKISVGQHVEFTEGAPSSYFYYWLVNIKNKK